MRGAIASQKPYVRVRCMRAAIRVMRQILLSQRRIVASASSLVACRASLFDAAKVLPRAQHFQAQSATQVYIITISVVVYVQRAQSEKSREDSFSFLFFSFISLFLEKRQCCTAPTAHPVLFTLLPQRPKTPFFS